jgi:hypothetical protein
MAIFEKVTFDDSRTWLHTERDMSFHPAQRRNLHRLTPEQIDFYNANGYLLPFRIYSAAEIAEIRRYFDRILEGSLQVGNDSYSIRRWQNRSQVVWDIATHPLILDHVEDILGPDFVAWGTHFFCKLPGDGKPVSWHQDASYWPLTPTRSVTAWLAIDDSDCGNGCMRVLPGTHTQGHLEFDMGGVEENSVLPQKIKDIAKYGEPVDFELKAGEISLHSDMLVHGSEANNSPRRRCGLTIRYAAADVRSLDADWNKNSILCRGTDAAGNWANLSRPEKDILG